MRHHVKNSRKFSTEIASVLTDDDESFVLLDVVLVLMNTPVNEVLEVIHDQLKRIRDLKTE